MCDSSVQEAVEKYGALVASEDAYLLFENVPHDIGGVNLQSYISYLKTWVDRKEVCFLCREL